MDQTTILKLRVSNEAGAVTNCVRKNLCDHLKITQNSYKKNLTFSTMKRTYWAYSRADAGDVSGLTPLQRIMWGNRVLRSGRPS